MSQGRHGIKVLGLSLIAALGLMAFTAAAAQAGEYRIEGKTLTARGLTSETVSGTIAAGKLLVSGLPLTISCTGGTFVASILLGDIIHFSALFSGCEADTGPVCKPFETHSKMEENKTIDKGFIVASGLGELILMGTAPNNHYLLASSTEFATIYWPKLCVLRLEAKVSGSTVFFLPKALEERKEQMLETISQATLESLFPSHVLLYEIQTAILDGGGTTNAALTGSNTGKTWGGE